MASYGEKVSKNKTKREVKRKMKTKVWRRWRALQATVPYATQGGGKKKGANGRSENQIKGLRGCGTTQVF